MLARARATANIQSDACPPPLPPTPFPSHSPTYLGPGCIRDVARGVAHVCHRHGHLRPGGLLCYRYGDPAATVAGVLKGSERDGHEVARRRADTLGYREGGAPRGHRAARRVRRGARRRGGVRRSMARAEGDAGVGTVGGRGFNGWDGTTRVGQREAPFPLPSLPQAPTRGRGGAHLGVRSKTEPRCHLLRPLRLHALPRLVGLSVLAPVPGGARLTPKFAAGCVPSRVQTSNEEEEGSLGGHATV